MRPSPLLHYRTVNVLCLFFFAKDSPYREINFKWFVTEDIRLCIEKNRGTWLKYANEVLNGCVLT